MTGRLTAEGWQALLGEPRPALYRVEVHNPAAEVIHTCMGDYGPFPWADLYLTEDQASALYDVAALTSLREGMVRGEHGGCKLVAHAYSRLYGVQTRVVMDMPAWNGRRYI